MKTDKKTENEIVEMINSYGDAYTSKDLDGMLDFF
jgi:hypothetical protein